MNKTTSSFVVAFAIAILFFIQMAGTLVESIYILDLMNLKLDEKVMGLLFFFVPLLLFPLFHRFARQTAWGLCAVLLISRGMLAFLGTNERMLAAGMGSAAALTLLFLLLARNPGQAGPVRIGILGAAGLSLAVTLSVSLRTMGSGLDYSLIPAGGWLGWALALMLTIAVVQLEWGQASPVQEAKPRITGPVMGVIFLLTLVWFSFAAPSVIARWTEGNYTLIIVTVSLLAALATWILIARPNLPDRIHPRILLIWNILFCLSMTATLLAHRVSFPKTPESAPVVVTSPDPLSQVFLVLMLLLSPVLFLDLRLFVTRIAQAAPRTRDLAPGFVLGMLALSVLILSNIFSNVWAYVPPVSPIFRNTFWLAFFILSAGSTLLAWRAGNVEAVEGEVPPGRLRWGWGLLLGALFLGTAIKAVPAGHEQVEPGTRTSLIAMTFNTQQSNDGDAEKSFEQQLALIRRVSPDVLALQESDSTRISLNNNDYVRYFADQLGYYSYFGPTTVTGTYGTAILSKYPLENTRTVFTYSDTDEIGTSQAEIEVDGRRFTIYNVHPAGSETAKLAFASALLERAKTQPYVIILGDHNLRDYEKAYQLIDSQYTNAWTSVYPTEISPDGVDMSGENRIDHIFVSPVLGVRNPVYLLPPDSATDHPVHWAEIYWATP